MDVTVVIRRLRAEPLSPRVHPLYLQEGGAMGRMARAASAPASSTPRAQGAPAPDQAHCSVPLAELGGMLVSGRSLDAGPGCAPGRHSFPALSAPGEAAAVEGAGLPGDGAADADAPGYAAANAGPPGVGAADAGALGPVLPSGACASDSDALAASLAAPVRAHASAAAAALMASRIGNPFAAAADAGGADDACGAADERGGVAVSGAPPRSAGGGGGAGGGGSGAHEAGAAQLSAAVDVAVACGAALRNGHCSAACSGCLNCVGIKARGGCQWGSRVLLCAVRAAQCVGAHAANARLAPGCSSAIGFLHVMRHDAMRAWFVASCAGARRAVLCIRACGAHGSGAPAPAQEDRSAAIRAMLAKQMPPELADEEEPGASALAEVRPPARPLPHARGPPAAACARPCAGRAGRCAAQGTPAGAARRAQRPQADSNAPVVACFGCRRLYPGSWSQLALRLTGRGRAGRRRPGPARGVVHVGRRVQPGGVLGRRRQRQQPEPGEQQQQRLRAQPGVCALARLVPVHCVGDRAAGAPAP